MNSGVLQIENLSTAGNFKLKENLILWHKPSKRQIFCKLRHTAILKIHVFIFSFCRRGIRKEKDSMDLLFYQAFRFYRLT